LKPVVECQGTISQWISGLLWLAPFVDKKVTVKVLGGLNEPTYVGTTIWSMARFGVQVEPAADYQSFTVAPGQVYRATEFHIPGDFALAAYGFALAALTGSHLLYTNLDMDSIQAEKGIVPFLQRMGADITLHPQAKMVEVRGGRRLQGIEWDANDTPDLVPILSVLCAVAKGKSRIYNAAQVRLKECDRIAAMTQLNKMGARVTEYPDALEFDGVDHLHGAEIDSYHDHRVQMAFVVAGVLADGETYVSDAEAAKISYPDFLDDMARLGMPVEVVERRGN